MDTKFWRAIHWIMEGKDKDPPKDLLTEPEETEGEEKDEASMGGVAGVAMPLGVGPHYPNPEPGGRMPAWKANAKAFGNAAIGKIQQYKGKKKG